VSVQKKLSFLSCRKIRFVSVTFLDVYGSGGQQ